MLESQDPIVQEIPVNFASHHKSLMLLQYPTRPIFNEQKPVQVQLKQNKLQFKLLLPRGEHYDMDQGVELGKGVGNQPILTALDVSAGKQYENSILNYIDLESTPVPLNATYMIGIQSDDGLHFTNLESILQLRPTLNYIDNLKEKEKQANIRINEGEQENLEEGKSYQITTRGADPETDQKLKMASIKKALENEPWQTLELFDMDTEKAQEDYNYLILKQDEEMEQDDDDVEMHYTDLLGQSVDSQSVDVKHQVEKILMNAHITNIDNLKRICDFQDENALLDILKPLSVMMNGRFIVKSSSLYTGKPEIARNYLLGLFLENEFVQQDALVAESHIPYQMALNMLNEIAVKSSNGWKLKVDKDLDIVTRHPEFTAEQSELIKKEAKSALEALKSKPNGRKGSKAVRRDSIPQENLQLSDISDIPIEGKTSNEQATMFIKKILIAKGPCSMKQIRGYFDSRKQDPNKKNMLKNFEVSTEWLETHLSLYAENVSDYFVIKTDDPARSAIIDLFREKKQVRKGDVVKALNDAGLGQIPNTAYSRIMQELATPKGAYWHFKLDI